MPDIVITIIILVIVTGFFSYEISGTICSIAFFGWLGLLIFSPDILDALTELEYLEAWETEIIQGIGRLQDG